MSRTIIGTVSSDKADKTITVSIETKRRHHLYDKQYKVSNKYHAHDETNLAKLGDTVEIIECRPISKKKSWKLNQVIKKNEN